MDMQEERQEKKKTAYQRKKTKKKKVLHINMLNGICWIIIINYRVSVGKCHCALYKMYRVYTNPKCGTSEWIAKCKCTQIWSNQTCDTPRSSDRRIDRTMLIFQITEKKIFVFNRQSLRGTLHTITKYLREIHMLIVVYFVFFVVFNVEKI